MLLENALGSKSESKATQLELLALPAGEERALVGCALTLGATAETGWAVASAVLSAFGAGSAFALYELGGEAFVTDSLLERALLRASSMEVACRDERTPTAGGACEAWGKLGVLGGRVRVERVAGEGRSALNEDNAAAGGEKLERTGLVGGPCSVSLTEGLEGGTGDAKLERLPRTGTPESAPRWGRTGS